MKKQRLHPYSVKYRYVPESVVTYHQRLREHGMKTTSVSRLGHIESMSVEARNKPHARRKFHEWFAQFPESKDIRKITAIVKRR